MLNVKHKIKALDLLSLLVPNQRGFGFLADALRRRNLFILNPDFLDCNLLILLYKSATVRND